MPITLIRPTSLGPEEGILHDDDGFDRLLLPTGAGPEQLFMASGRYGFLAARQSELSGVVSEGRVSRYETVTADGLGDYDADLLLIPGGPLKQVAATVRAARRMAARQGRYPEFLLSIMPFLGATEAAARQRASNAEKAPRTPAFDGEDGAITLAGTPEQIVRSIMEFYDIGIEHMLLLGVKSERDAAEYGRDLIPLLRRKVTQRDGMLGMLAG